MVSENYNPWYKNVEKAKDKARKLVNKTVAVNQATSVVVGKLEGAEIDKMGPAHHATCKITLNNVKRYDLKTDFKFKDEEIGVFFVNNPDSVMTIQELGLKFPNLHEEVNINIKKGVWDGS